MNAITEALSPFVTTNPFLAYLIVYGATIILGNLAAFTALWIGLHNNFGASVLPLIILSLFLADISGDLLWYFSGRALRDTKFGNFIKERLPGHRHIERHIHRNSARWIVLSKFIYSTTFPIIFSVGWAKIEFKKFLPYSLLAIATSIPLLVLIAYGISSWLSPLEASFAFRQIERILAIGIVTFFIVRFAIGKIVKLFTDRDDPDEI